MYIAPYWRMENLTSYQSEPYLPSTDYCPIHLWQRRYYGHCEACSGPLKQATIEAKRQSYRETIKVISDAVDELTERLKRDIKEDANV